jgi:hypothetical protein
MAGSQIRRSYIARHRNARDLRDDSDTFRDLRPFAIDRSWSRRAQALSERETQVRPDLFEWLVGDGAVAATSILPMLVSMVATGGCLAVEFPNDLYEPSRALMRMIAADGPWAKTLLPIAKTRPFNETLEGLYALLGPICATVDIWEVTYLHAMASVAAIIEWMEATSLAPFLTALDEANRRKFLDSLPPNCAWPIRLSPVAKFCCGRGVSSYWRSRNARPVHHRGFAFIVRAQRASSIRSAISRK